MRSKLLQEAEGRKVFALVFDKGDEAKNGLTDFAKRQGLGASQITAIGAFQKVTLACFDRETKAYLEIPIDEQVEVLSLLGDVVIDKGEPSVHAHCVVGRRDGTIRGGHLVEGYVWPTLEVIVSESPRHLRKRYDPETGLTLIDA
jgi:hypothetical protein